MKAFWFRPERVWGIVQGFLNRMSSKDGALKKGLDGGFFSTAWAYLAIHYPIEKVLTFQLSNFK